MVSRFALDRVSLPMADLGEGFRQSAASFHDYIIDGESLRLRLKIDDISVLYVSPENHHHENHRWQRDVTRSLLPGAKEARDPRLGDRSQIFGCRECLDIECGGIAVSIARVADRVRWDDFVSFGRVYDAEHNWILEPITIGPYEFSRAQYEAAIKAVL